MCGIAGFVGRENPDVAASISECLAHRGPNASVIQNEQDLGLTLIHRRLSVIDIDGGQQPMWTADRSFGVVFNGEIYNHIDLRSELTSLGHQFQTDHSDTECLIHGYAEWGPSLVERLNGMFAFAIVDRRRREIYLARDRCGEKPLYIYHDQETFAFGSETQVFECLPGVRLHVDPAALAKYFSFGFFPGRTSLFRNVGKLGPGEHVTIPLDALRSERSFDWEAHTASYWQLNLQPEYGAFAKRTDADVAEEFWSHFQTAVERRLVSDVPLGLFLSGGLDSGATLAAMRALLPAEQVSCFTLGFEDKSYDESAMARTVAQHFGCRHYTGVASEKELFSHIHTVLAAMHEPLADASILPTAMLARFARERATVVLSGDGGDELLAGYDPLLALRFARLCRHFALPFVGSLVRHLLSLLPKRNTYMSLEFRLARALEGVLEERPLWEPVWMSPIPPRRLPDALSTDVGRDAVFADVFALYDRIGKSDTLDQALSYFTQFYLTNDILVKSDRATMMSSLECRAVFLDNDLVAFCERLPNSYKLRGTERKFILRKALQDKVPSALLEQPKKGFGVPISQWMRDELPKNPTNAVPYLRQDFVAKAIEDHSSMRTDERLFLFSWLAMKESLEAQKEDAGRLQVGAGLTTWRGHPQPAS